MIAQADDVAGARIVPALAGIPETMLWTLYARARAELHGTPVLHDPEAVRISAAIDYDFEGRFGAAYPLFAVRAKLIDAVITHWLQRHPDGLIVSLGEGLETQRCRVDNGRMQWLTVDLPSAIRLRERFLPAGGRFRHLAASATEPDWMDAIGTPSALLVVAQGLLMYLPQDDVRRLLLAIASRFPGAELVFDVVQRTFSASTVRGHGMSGGYVLPPMPWGLDRQEVVPTLRAWGLPVRAVRLLPYRVPRRRPAVIDDVLDAILVSRRQQASLVHLTV
jgi:O-methyltransferase involved in polyketide biosynthesis